MGSLFSSPSPPGPLPDPPNPPNLFDPRIAAMRRQRLEELKRKKGRQATILTAGLGDRTETTRQPVRNRTFPVLPGAPHTANILLGAESNFGKGRARVRLPGRKHTAPVVSPPASTVPIDALVQLVGVGQTPTPPQPQPPAPQQPETPQRPQPEPPKPQQPKPDEPEPDRCERIEDELRQVNGELDAVRQEETRTRQRINDLEDEIAALRDAPGGGMPSVDRPSQRPGSPLPRGPVGVLPPILRIGGRLFPVISAVITAKGVIDFVNRSQMIAAAKQELAALKTKLEEILDKERGLLFSRSGLERAVAECKQRNKRPGRSP